MELKIYVVSLKLFDDLEQFYDDMETPGGNLYIPDREVDISLRRPISRNTHYYLTDAEAELVRQDSRVLAVELRPEDRGLEPISYWTQTGAFQKSSTYDSSHKNWGLLRSVAGFQTSGWGTDGGAFTIQNSQTIVTTSSGRNVDVVIVDSHINPQHPEFAKNSDGTGGSRVNQIDWNLYANLSGYATTGSYTYSNISSNHGTHVAGTACGNTQGWARDANIYNMEFNYENPPSGATWAYILWDFLRAFHRQKPINPNTGRRNPTITNHSWGYSLSQQVSISTITSVNYRGVTYDTSSLSEATRRGILETYGIPVPYEFNLNKIPARVAAVDLDIQDAISDGVIVISSAGNSSWCCVPNQNYSDWNNSFTVSSGSNPTTTTFNVSVAPVGGSNRYHINGVDRPTLNFIRGSTYIFDQSDSSNVNHPLFFSTVADGSNYTTGVTTIGTPGQAGARTTIIVNATAPSVLYYKCGVHSGMGASAMTTGGFTSTTTHSRGTSPGCADGVICVGSVGSKHIEKKASYSNWGPRIDIWAPGTNIISSVYDTTAAGEFQQALIADPRGGGYLLASISGTSMASPQVTGIVACLAEQEPNITQSDVKLYLNDFASKSEQLFLQEGKVDWINAGSLAPSQSPYEQLRVDDNNKFLFYHKVRPIVGITAPRSNFKRRPASGSVYPRPRRSF